MLYVFSVDIGTLYSFEMELAMESVQTLMLAIASTTGITVDKQVLLVTGGEALDPNDRVCNYSNAGTDTSPIYLFSKSTIESSVPPSPSITLGSESCLKDQVEVSFKLPPTYETLVARAQLASEFNHYAVEIARNCERLVNEQSFQQLGWAAVVANLDNISREFNERITTVELSYKEFLDSRSRYLELLKGYDEILNVLAKIPVLPSLLPRQQADRPEFTDGLSLLDWISAQDSKNSLHDMVIQCNTAIEQFDGSVLQGVMTEVMQVQEALNNSSMKEIKGLDERLMRLQELLQRVQELVQSQAEMAQGFIQNQTRAQNIGDASVLPDLCASHQKQLMMLMKNHSQLRDYLRRCAKAKEELSVNLHTRLRWIMYVEKKVCDSDSTLIIYHENIRRVKRRLDILDQVSEAPKLYIVATAEVVRRRRFSSQFLKWATKLHESVYQMQLEENARREEFALKFGRHFLQTLFPGLDDRPSTFADKLPKTFDTHLPIITEQDLECLQGIEPILKDYLSDSPLNVSMRDDANESSTMSFILKLQESQMVTSQGAIKDLSASKTAMSVDASTQAAWIDEAKDSSSKPTQVSWIEETEDSSSNNLNEQIKRNLKDASQSSAEESVPIQSGGESPPKGYHRDSDTGSEPSSGLTDSDIMFRSAQEDYVTVVEADFDSKDGNFLQKDEAVTREHDCSQTLTLTSSGSQSITTSTQTDNSLEEIKLVYSEMLSDSREKTDSNDNKTIADLENRIKELEDALENTTLSYNNAVQDNVKLVAFKTNVKELLDNTVASLRKELNLSKEFISGCGVKLNQEIEATWQNVQGFITDTQSSISNISVQQTREEYQQIIKQQNEKYEHEKNELLNLKLQLELDKNNLAMELQSVTKEKDAKELQSADEFRKLQAVAEEYKLKLVCQQNILTKQREVKGKTEEEQQTRMNSIIMSLTREKKQIVAQLNEKMNEMKMEYEKQRDKLQEYEHEMESMIKERELQVLSLKEREEKTNASELKLREMDSKWNEREIEFRNQLEQEKANALLLLEVERQMWEAGQNQQEDTEMEDSTTSYIRKQSDVTTLDYEQRIAQLEQEYQIACEKLETQQEAISQALRQLEEGEINPILHQAKQAIISKDEQIKALKKQLLQQTGGAASAVSNKPDKVTLKDFQCGDLVLLVYDPRYENYLIFSTGLTLYFLHPESMGALDLSTSGTKRRDLVLAQLTDKEYCQAKKAHNRFHVPVGTKFYRIQAKPWER